MNAKRSSPVANHPQFDERLFEARLWSLRRRNRMIVEKPRDLRYTVFFMRLLWVAVVFPFLAGAACAFLFGR